MTPEQELTRPTNPITNRDTGDENEPGRVTYYTPVLKMPTGQETRIKDPLTGGEKGIKLQRFDLIPPEAHAALAEVYGRGAGKYEDRNWEKGYKWGLSVGALERHFNAWKRGESIDAETGCYHLMQVAWHAFCLFTFELRGLGTDDVRIKPKTK